MPSYEFQCVNQSCEANVRIDRPIKRTSNQELECPFCHDYMSLIYANAEV
jgi:aspartate carbamoyltransferase regulatory subunit